VSERRIIVHSLEHARAALEAASVLNKPATLISARGIASFMGPLWFKALIDQACSARPEVECRAVLDCADEAGTVLAALRTGFKRVRFTGPEATRVRLDEIACQIGALVEGAVPFEGLDLLDAREPGEACREFLARD